MSMIGQLVGAAEQVAAVGTKMSVAGFLVFGSQTTVLYFDAQENLLDTQIFTKRFCVIS